MNDVSYLVLFLCAALLVVVFARPAYDAVAYQRQQRRLRKHAAARLKATWAERTGVRAS